MDKILFKSPIRVMTAAVRDAFITQSGHTNRAETKAKTKGRFPIGTVNTILHSCHRDDWPQDAINSTGYPVSKEASEKTE